MKQRAAALHHSGQLDPIAGGAFQRRVGTFLIDANIKHRAGGHETAPAIEAVDPASVGKAVRQMDVYSTEANGYRMHA